MALTLVTAPTITPISVAELIEHLRIDGTADEAIVLSCLRAGVEQAEAYTKRALCQQTWKWFLDSVPYGNCLQVPKAPLQSVTHIKYYDVDGIQTTWSSALYQVDTDSEPGRLAPIYGGTWPTYRFLHNTIEIQFVAGYVSPARVPESIKQAIKLIAGHLYENREEVGFLTPSRLPMGALTLLNTYEVSRMVA